MPKQLVFLIYSIITEVKQSPPVLAAQHPKQEYHKPTFEVIDLSITSPLLAWGKINWADLEKAGAVFLPASGYRDGTGDVGIGGLGCYWSSSSYEKDNSFYLRFGDDGVLWGRYYRCYGHSVRLVRAL